MIKIEQEISRILDHSLDSCIQNLKEKSTDIGVANGLAGMSIFLSDIYKTTNSVDKKILIKNTNLKITQAMINSINKNNVSLSLFSGLSGVGTACLEMAKYDSNYLKLLTQISLIILLLSSITRQHKPFFICFILSCVKNTIIIKLIL